MHALAKLSLANRALIALITVSIAIFGALLMTNLKQELIPSISLPQVSVVTSYQGASPEIVDEDVSQPIESALQGLQGLDSTTTTSSDGQSVVSASFEFGTDIVYAEQRIQQALNRIDAQLPEDADWSVLSGSIDDLPVVQLAFTGGDPTQLAERVEQLAVPELRGLDGVRAADVSGDRAERITIAPDQEALAANGLSLQDITDTLDDAGVLVPAGTITEGDETLTVQAGDLLASVDELREIPMPVSADATTQQDPTAPAATPTVVTLGDVADVEQDYAPITSISRVNGEDALTVSVTKRPSANTVEVSQAVASVLPEIEAALGDDVTVTVALDQAPFIQQSIDTLVTEGLLGLAFAVLVIFFFLFSVRATLITAISIPTSLLVTFIALYFLDYSLNVLTLGALTIAIGRVVDDSIVVVENIRRHLTMNPSAALRGGERVKVITEAVREVGMAITASTLVTVAVFLPVIFVGDVTGELFRPFGLTSAVALLASLFVSLTIVPVLAYWFMGGSKVRASEVETHGAHAVDAEADEPRNWLQKFYEPLLRRIIVRPGWVLVGAVVVLAGTIALIPLMKTNFLGSAGQNTFQMSQEVGVNASLDAKTAYAERLESVLDDTEGIDIVQVSYGGGDLISMFTGGGSNTITWSITTDPEADADAIQSQLRDEVEGRDDLGDVEIGASAGFSTDVTVRVSAPDADALREAVDAVTPAVEGVEGVQQVNTGIDETRPFIELNIDQTAAAEAGLNEVAIGGQVMQALQPVPAGSIMIDGSSLQVYFVGDEKPPVSVDELRELDIQTGTGVVPLSDLADVEVTDGPVSITAESSTPYTDLTIVSESDDLGGMSSAITEAIDDIELPGGATAELGGSAADQQQAFQQLGLAMLAAILVVYIVMVATLKSLLQPLLLLVSVPFAATGAILLQVATGLPLGVASLIGVLMLIGIVVTNAIVLIDLVNQFRNRGNDVREATFDGATRRVRPIVMTALATILALTPMALGITGHGGFISQPMAVVVIGGLLSSTLLTLVVLPALYVLVEGRREKRANRRAERNEQKLQEAGLA